MPRLLVVSNLYAPVEIGGYEILCRQVVEGLARRGWEVAVLTSTGASADVCGYRVIPTLTMTAPFGRADNRSRLRRARVHRRNWRATRDALREHKPDAVLCFSFRRITLGPAAAISESGLPNAYVINDAWPLSYLASSPGPTLRSRIGNFLDTRVFAQHTIAAFEPGRALILSQSLRDELHGAGLCFADEHVVPQGVPTDVFAPGRNRAAKGPLRLLYAGQLHSYKGVHHVLEAVSELEEHVEREAMTLTIAGAGDEAYAFRLRRRASRLRTPVDFVGRVPSLEMPAFYRDFDALVFPSVWNEPMGLCHLEAMATGLPVVIAAAGGCRELAERCPSALSYPPGDVRSLVRQLRPLVESAGRRRSIGRANRDWVCANASLEGYIDQLENQIAR